ncbi:asparagine synthase-related protein [Candidatus Parvarchaeota archaeon]|nr:asparagine synthase-related protein [Candidatus Parvarchaeota archaeon]
MRLKTGKVDKILGRETSASAEMLKNTISTDILNSRCETFKLGDLNLILPGMSSVEIKDSNSVYVSTVPFNKSAGNGILESLETYLYDIGKLDCVLISGGIDSSLLAAVASKIYPKLNLITVGFPGSEDLEYSKALAEDIGKDVIEVVLTEEKVSRIIKKLKELDLCTYNVIMGVIEYAAIEAGTDREFRTFASGLGSDELFFGFDIYSRMPHETMEETRNERLYYAPAVDLIRIKKISERLRARVYLPYLDDGIASYALSNVHPGTETGGVKFIKSKKYSLYNKSLLRFLGEQLGLSEQITLRKKKAMQYGSGLLRSLRTSSKKTGFKNVGDFIKNI